MKAANILETIGNTPHIRVSRLFPDAEVWIKSERANPGGSIKDRIGLSMIEDAEKSGALKPGVLRIAAGTVPAERRLMLFGDIPGLTSNSTCLTRLTVCPGPICS